MTQFFQHLHIKHKTQTAQRKKETKYTCGLDGYFTYTRCGNRSDVKCAAPDIRDSVSGHAYAKMHVKMTLPRMPCVTKKSTQY